MLCKAFTQGRSVKAMSSIKVEIREIERALGSSVHGQMSGMLGT